MQAPSRMPSIEGIEWTDEVYSPQEEQVSVGDIQWTDEVYTESTISSRQIDTPAVSATELALREEMERLKVSERERIAGSRKGNQASNVTYVDKIDTGIEGNYEKLKLEVKNSLLNSLRSDVVDPQTGESFGLEGFSEALYVPPGEKSGLTIGTGIDLGQWTPQSLSGAGVSQEIVEKLSPYIGKKDKRLAGKSPLTKEEVEELDSAILEHTLGELRNDIPNFDSLPESLRLAVMAAKHQYGKGAPALMAQAKEGDYLGAIVNLLTWTDKTKGAGDTIAKKYQALGKKLIQELTYNGG